MRLASEGMTVPITWSESLDALDWHELSALYKAAPLGDKSVAWLRTAFSHSLFRCFARDEGRLVGAGRALADGVDCAYLCDIAVLPSHQGQGLGKAIIARLLERAQGHRKNHPVRGTRQGAVLSQARLPAHDDRDGDLREPGQRAGARLPQRRLGGARVAAAAACTGSAAAGGTAVSTTSGK